MKDYKNYYNGEFSDYDKTDPNYIIANQKYPTSVDDENISEETTYSSNKIEGLISGVTSGSCIDDSNVSDKTTYSSAKIEELVKDFVVIEDDKVSDKTTYSSNKIEELISGATSGSCIDDSNVSEETTYSSSKLEEVFGKVVILTQEEYDSLEVKDEQTFYIISDAS